jgi:hypothetical protein
MHPLLWVAGGFGLGWLVGRRSDDHRVGVGYHVWQDPPVAPVVGWDWPWVDLPIAPKATMHTQTDPYSLLTLPGAIEQFYVHKYVVPEARALDRWLSSR